MVGIGKEEAALRGRTGAVTDVGDKVLGPHNHVPWAGGVCVEVLLQRQGCLFLVPQLTLVGGP